MKRFVELDILRGVLLLMMVVDHSPSALRRFTDQPLGFFTTAECFGFVSAFLAGLLFRKREEKTGFGAACASTLQRDRRIYLAHLFTVCFAFTAGSLFLAQLPGLGNLLDHYLANPWAGLAGSLALVFRPPLMDILPMYVLFSLLTPAAFWAAKRWGWKTVLLLSFSIWVIAQTHVRDRVVGELKDLPFIQLGPFDLLAWQFLWVGGLFIGQRSIERKSLLLMPQVLRPLLLLLTMTFLFSRWSSLANGSATVTQTWLLDKWHLGPIRLINFCLAASVAASFLKHLANWEAHFRPLQLIGRHMLPVFCSQICLSVLLIGRTESGLTAEPITSLLVIGQLSTAFLFAWLLERRLSNQQSPRMAPPTLASARV